MKIKTFIIVMSTISLMGCSILLTKNEQYIRENAEGIQAYKKQHGGEIGDLMMSITKKCLFDEIAEKRVKKIKFPHGKIYFQLGAEGKILNAMYEGRGDKFRKCANTFAKGMMLPKPEKEITIYSEFKSSFR